jgi:pimeloyl-ACP methyl ester carboxylesterase
MRHLYLHGFASGPASFKAVYIKERLAECGVELVIPDLNVPSFEHMTLTAMLEVAEKHLPERTVVWGSSLGGYLATYLAHSRPEKVERLVLLAPAFDFPVSFPIRTRGAEEAWGAGKSVPIYHHASKRDLPLAGDLQKDCAKYPASPEVKCPALVVAASRDETIPFSSIERWVKRHPQATLDQVDDQHEMIQSRPQVANLTLRYLGLKPA